MGTNYQQMANDLGFTGLNSAGDFGNSQGFANLNNSGESSSDSNPVDTSGGLSYNPELREPISSFTGNEYKIQNYNGQKYKVQIYLDNSGEWNSPRESNRYYINPASILNLIIDDTITNWVVNGSLTFLYIPDGAPSKSGDDSGQDSSSYVSGAQSTGNALKSFYFRGDGFDMLRVIFTPVTENDGAGDTLVIDESDSKWTLSYLFAITEIEDINEIPELEGPSAPYMKCLKLYFHDLRYQLLKTSNISYSTAESPEAIFGSGMSNDGVLPTGTAIREIFNTVLSDPDIGGAMEFYISPGIDWDVGSSRIFYTSPAGYSAIDDIDYVLNNHVSAQPTKVDGVYDLSLLHTSRPSTAGLLEDIQLSPLQSFLEGAVEGNQAGPAQLEHFFVTSQTREADKQESIKNDYRGPFSNSSDRDFKAFKYGQIISYSFVDMSPDVNCSGFITTPVYSVDIGKRLFNATFKNNDVLTAREVIAETYITKFYQKGSSAKDLFLPQLHKSKQNKNIFPVFTLNGEENANGKILRQKSGILQLLYTGFFQNACICFSTFGLTLRQSGSIIAIDKSEGCDDNDYNNKLYGQWFVVKVVHGFEGGSYMNRIYAVKLNRYREADTKFQSVI